MAKKKLLIYAHYYIPDTASTGQILRELAEGMLDKFDITVKDDKIVSVVPTEINDTEYVGDKIDNPVFLDQFAGMDLKNDITVEKNDAVSGATFSSKSAVRAVEEVRKALGY